MSFADVEWLVLALTIGLLALAEVWFPLRTRTAATIGDRWPTNVALAAIVVALAICVPSLIGLTSAAVALGHDWGLFRQFDLPFWITWPVTFVVLDAAGYLVHRATHELRWLWRFHRVHHSDHDVDLTSAWRHHPIDIVLTIFARAAPVLLLGPPLEAIVMTDLVQRTFALVVHANLRIPAGLERALRVVVVTPHFHSIHHSTSQPETDSNYGGVLSMWDRLFGTYRAAPIAGYAAPSLGLDEFDTRESRRLWWLLAEPFLPRRFQLAR